MLFCCCERNAIKGAGGRLVHVGVVTERKDCKGRERQNCGNWYWAREYLSLAWNTVQELCGWLSF